MDTELLAETLVKLADTMVADFDLTDFLHFLTNRSVQLLDVSAAGLLLADPDGELRVVAASSEAARLLELFQIQNDQGPCLDCFRTGEPVHAGDLAAEARRWPKYIAVAQRAGFAAVQALPMRLREQIIGALNLFRVSPGSFPPTEISTGQALADAATIGLLHERRMRQSTILNEQLQTALTSRVIIEQAKGKLSERLGIDVDQAFNLLRDFARNRNIRLSELARALVEGTAKSADLTAAESRKPPTTGQGRLSACYALARRSTLPFFRHDVQTLSRTGEPSTVARTRWTFGFHRRDDLALMRRLIAFLPKRATLLPKCGSLPHRSHRSDTGKHL